MFTVQERIEFLALLLSRAAYKKISNSPDIVKAIVDMKQPKPIEEPRIFLGMVMCYSHFNSLFIPNT